MFALDILVPFMVILHVDTLSCGFVKSDRLLLKMTLFYCYQVGSLLSLSHVGFFVNYKKFKVYVILALAVIC